MSPLIDYNKSYPMSRVRYNLIAYGGYTIDHEWCPDLFSYFNILIILLQVP